MNGIKVRKSNNQFLVHLLHETDYAEILLLIILNSSLILY